jgi:benzoylformate decarboxylase
MATVKDRIYEILRAHGLNVIFGNPGSTELPFLQEYPGDFSYILGLQEASVVAMATGYSLVTDNAAVVNLHTTAGTGNAMGAIVTAWHERAPIIITAGQQDRRIIPTEPFLWGRQAEFVKPYVKWSIEPHRAVDVPFTIERAYHVAMSEPRGPVFVSIPMDGLGEECPPLEARRVSYRTAPDPGQISELRTTLLEGKRIAIVAGEEVDESGAIGELVTLAEKLAADVFLTPISYRWSFPSNHRLFRGRLPPAAGPLAQRLAPYDTVFVVGAPIFLYYPYVPGEAIKHGTKVLQLTCDSSMSSRALVGRSYVGNVKLGLEEILKQGVGERTGAPPPEKRGETTRAEPTRPPSPRYVHEQLAEALPENVVIFEEDPSTEVHFQAKILTGGSYFATASGGLGFAMPAAVGAALATKRPVVALLGEGSAQYSIQSLWSSAHYGAAVTFIIFNNSEYAILKSFGQLLRVKNVPGLDIPGIDFEGLAKGYGVAYRKITEPDQIVSVVKEATRSGKPSVVEIPVDPSVTPLLG